MPRRTDYVLRLGRVAVPARLAAQGRLIVNLRHAHRVGGLMQVFHNGEQSRMAQIVGLDEEAGELHYVY